jgi:importin-7
LADKFLGLRDRPTRQAATLWLKNHVHRTGRTADLAKLSAQERAVVEADSVVLKASILGLLVASPSRIISVQLAATLKDLVANEFPSKWPSLLNEIKGLLAGGNVREVHAGCLALLEVVRAFRSVHSSLVQPIAIHGG